MAEIPFGGGFRAGAPAALRLACRDPARAAAFYGGVLGLPAEGGAAPGAARFALGAGAALVLEPAAPGAETAGAGLELAVSAHDLARAADWCRRLGLACRLEGAPARLVIRDPDGRAVVLTAPERAP